MGISLHGRAFSRDLLHVEVSRPNCLHLTIVDLPDLIHFETKQQSASNIELVQNLVQSYMAESKSIILMVVLATSRPQAAEVLFLKTSLDLKSVAQSRSISLL